MSKLAVLIHGMWGTSDVWRNWRETLEARGWHTVAPALRHHEAPPLEPPAALGATPLGAYVDDLAARIAALPERPALIGHSMGGLIALKLASMGLASAAVLLTPAPPAQVFAMRPSNVRAFLRIQLAWAWWRKPHRPRLNEALWHTFNTMDPREAARLYGPFVHESGRALMDIGLPWLDRARSSFVDPVEVRVPLLFVAAERDRLTPPSVVERSHRLFAHIAEYRLYAGQGHWVLGQPGWRDIADDSLAWLDENTRPVSEQAQAEFRKWRSSISRD